MATSEEKMIEDLLAAWEMWDIECPHCDPMCSSCRMAWDQAQRLFEDVKARFESRARVPQGMPDVFERARLEKDIRDLAEFREAVGMVVGQPEGYRSREQVLDAVKNRVGGLEHCHRVLKKQADQIRELEADLAEARLSPNELQELEELRKKAKVDGEVYNLGRSEGRCDVYTEVRKLVDPTDANHFNADGTMRRLRELLTSVSRLEEQNALSNLAVRKLMRQNQDLREELGRLKGGVPAARRPDQLPKEKVSKRLQDARERVAEVLRLLQPIVQPPPTYEKKDETCSTVSPRRKRR